MRTRFFAWVLVAAGFLAPVTAQAASFSISNIRFSNEVGNNERFKWSVEWAPDLSLDLKVGEKAVVTYGALIIHDLPTQPSGARDDTNSFQVEFELSPSEEIISAQGSPRARFSPGPVSVSVNFDNRPHSFSLGDGREISLTFLDSTRVENSGLFLLSAKIELISDTGPVDKSVDEQMTEPTTAMPEPVKLAHLESDHIGLDVAKR